MIVLYRRYLAIKNTEEVKARLTPVPEKIRKKEKSFKKNRTEEVK
jgi:hypothetical protein